MDIKSFVADLTEQEYNVVMGMREDNRAKREKNLRKLVSSISEDFRNVYPSDPNDILDNVKSVIYSYGFLAPDFSECFLNDSGCRTFDLKGCFLALSWYRMPSGNWELVFYIS